MKIFDVDVKQFLLDRKDILIPVFGSILGLSITVTGYSLYKRYKRPLDEAIKPIAGEDLELPLDLEHEYGDFRRTCVEADAAASAFLGDIPENFFSFNQNFLLFISAHFSSRFTKRKRVLIIGSSTGKLGFELGKTFAEVKGIENSFTKVIICYKFQNHSRVPYYFPLEGSYRTTPKSLKLDAFRPRRTDQRKPPVDHVQFIDADPCSRLAAQVGLFQVVILPNSLNDLSDPETLLERIHRFVEYDGLLIISSDYNWKRHTNQNVGFGHPGISNSFEFLQYILGDNFNFVEEKYILDAVPESLRSCKLRNCHVTVWARTNS